MDRLTVLKKEPMPEIVRKDQELQNFYNSTDLEFAYVYDCAKSLKPLKGIDVNLQQVEFWYREFLRMGWTTQIFNKRFETIKRATLYNRIDLENWLNSDVMYSEEDLNIAVKRKIDSMILRGEYLKDKKVELSEEDKKFVQLAELKKIEFELKNRRYELMESAAEELRKRYMEGLSEKKKKLMQLDIKAKMILVDELFDSGKIQGKKNGFEYQAILHHIEDYADLISD